MDEENFKVWKYFSAKFLSPMIAMGCWVYLIKSGVLVGDRMVFGVGLGLLLFGGILSAGKVLEVVAEKWKVK